MPTNLEIRTYHRTLLFDLFKLEKEYGNNEILDVLIARTTAAMDQEDVAYVRQIVNDLAKKK